MIESIHYDSGITKQLHGNSTFEGEQRIELRDISLPDHERLLGHLKFKRYQQPFPFAYIYGVRRKTSMGDISKAQAGKSTVGDLLVDKVNTYLEEKKLPGFLYNSIPATKSAHNLSKEMTGSFF